MDFVTDNNIGTLLRVQELVGNLPDYVAVAQVKTAESLQKLDSRFFADQENREFPVDDAASIWLSSAYFFAKAAKEMSPAKSRTVEHRLRTAAAVYGIENDVAGITDALRSLTEEKSAAYDDSAYALVTEYDGKPLRRFPISNAEELRESMEFFARNDHRYPFAWKRAACEKFVEKSAEFNVEPSLHVKQYASTGFPDLDSLEEELERRKMFVTEPHLKEAADAMLVVVQAGKAMSADEFKKTTLDSLVDLVADFDKYAGIAPYYNRRFLTPVAALFSADIAKVAAAADTVEILGYHVPMADLAGVSLEKFAELFDKEFADSLATDGKPDAAKIRSVIPTLPDPDKRALLQAI